MASIKITKSNFQSEVIESDKPVLIDFWATWCGPCKMASPIVEKLAEDESIDAKICKVNVDDEPELAQAFEVLSIPTFVVVKNGKVEKTAVGLQSEDALKELIE